MTNIIITDPDIAKAIREALVSEIEMEIDAIDCAEALQNIKNSIKALAACGDSEMALKYTFQILDEWNG